MKKLKNINSNKTYGQGNRPIGSSKRGSGGGSSGGGITQFDTQSNAMSRAIKETTIKLPINHFTPEDGTTFDFRKLAIVSTGTINGELFSFEVPKGYNMLWTHYALFNDALLATDTEFIPTINRNKVLKFHGDPSDNFRLHLGANAFMDDDSLYEANIAMRPSHIIRWGVTNTSGVDVVMGVRMKGVIDNSGKTLGKRFGG